MSATNQDDPEPKADGFPLFLSHTNLYGLIGKTLTHSFSGDYFRKKFEKEGLDHCHYELFPLDDIDDIRLLFEVYKNLKGLNVTIPYKEAVIPYLDELDEVAAEIGAVNCIHIGPFTKTGYNTDWIGFLESLQPHLKSHHQNALILGDGGAAKAVQYAMRQAGIGYKVVSRNPKDPAISYTELSEMSADSFDIVVQTTPLGTYPNTEAMPDFPVQKLNKNHICFDLVYNPSQTTFLRKAEEQGATCINGAKMLQLQAEKAWEIWQQEDPA